MGLLPPVILGALLIVAFALSSLQRLALDSHTGPMPARQIAYQMRTHHQGAVARKQADPSLDTVIDVPPPSMDIESFQFLSCIGGKYVSTVMMTITGDPLMVIPRVMIPPAEADAILEELARQSVLAPELGRTGPIGWSRGTNGANSPSITPVTGVGIIDLVSGSYAVRTSTGIIPIPDCLVPVGAPIIVTQVLP